MMSHRVLVPPDLSGSGRQYLLDRYYELIVSKEMRDKENVVQTCDAVLLHGESLSSKVLQNAGNRLKAISASRTMQDQADLLCASRLGIWVVDVDAVSYLSRAEYEIALLLSCCKQITRMDFLAHSQNETDFRPHNSTELYGKRIGFVGWDEVAFLVAQKCRLAFDMECCCYMDDDWKIVQSTVRHCESLEELFVVSDFICIHTPCVPELGLNLFKRMKPTAYMICMYDIAALRCRDLCDALHMDMLAGVAVNESVRAQTDGEQLLQNPLVTPILRSAYHTYESINRTDLFAAQALDSILSGRAVPELCTHPVNPRICLRS